MKTMYIVVLTYVRPLEEVDANREAHGAWLAAGYADGTFLASGRRVPRTGGIILAHNVDREALDALLRADPLQRLGIASAEVYAFDPTRGSDAFMALIDP